MEDRNIRNWLGATWIFTTYVVSQGLGRHGFPDSARELACKMFELVSNEADTREYYDGEHGIGQGLSPFWGWSALAYVMPPDSELGYDPTYLSAERIEPIALAHLGLEFQTADANSRRWLTRALDIRRCEKATQPCLRSATN